MIRVTLEFNTVEETIVMLGKMSALGKARRAANAAAPDAPSPSAGPAPAAAAPEAAAPRARKPRNDAGKPRRPYKKGGAEAAPVAADNAPTPGEVPAAAPPPAPSTPPAEMESLPDGRKDHEPQAAVPEQPVPSAEAAQKALERLFEAAPPKGGIEVARSALSAFGVTRLRDLPEGKRAEFIAVVDKALA